MYFEDQINIEIISKETIFNFIIDFLKKIKWNQNSCSFNVFLIGAKLICQNTKNFIIQKFKFDDKDEKKIIEYIIKLEEYENHDKFLKIFAKYYEKQNLKNSSFLKYNVGDFFSVDKLNEIFMNILKKTYKNYTEDFCISIIKNDKCIFETDIISNDKMKEFFNLIVQEKNIKINFPSIILKSTSNNYEIFYDLYNIGFTALANNNHFISNIKI